MSDLYTRLVSGAIFPLQERLKRHTTVEVRRRMERTQWLAPSELADLQIERLRSLLIHAQQHVPYYGEVFSAHGFDARKLDSVAALQGLPMLTKPLVRAHGEALKSRIAGPLTRLNTGGSSGEPLIFYLGRERVSHDVAAKWRATRWWGVDIGDPEIVVWGSPIEHGAQDRVRGLRDALMRTRLLPAFEMSAERLDGFVAAIRRRRPRMLFGYPSALAYIAAHAEQQGIAMNDLGVRVAFVTAERLYDSQRERISRVFGCPVANGYGSRDAGFIAHQCPLGGMHLTAEDVVIELIGNDGQPVAPDEPGEIVVTHLATRDYPFIRYRTGDVAIAGTAPCACGRGLPLLKEVQGRTTDFVVAADGTVMHGLALIYVIRDIGGVASFKITQWTRGRIDVQLVVDADFDRAACNSIVVGFRRRLGAAVDVRVDIVEAIPPEESGKYRYVVSHAVETH